MDASLPPYPIAIKRSTIKRPKDSVGADRTCFQHVGFQGSPHVSNCSILEFRIPDVKESTLGSARPLVPHDFDMARFGFGEEPVGVSAMAGNLFDVRAERAGDWDTAMVLLRMRSGALCHINCSRLCAYGYDQRGEAFGEQGMLASCNPTPNSLARHTAAGTSMRGRLHYFFIERCAYSYLREIDAFADTVETGAPPCPGLEDGRPALLLANAALEAARKGRTVRNPD